LASTKSARSKARSSPSKNSPSARLRGEAAFPRLPVPGGRVEGNQLQAVHRQQIAQPPQTEIVGKGNLHPLEADLPRRDEARFRRPFLKQERQIGGKPGHVGILQNTIGIGV
jgi:hypothetical protein